MNPRMWEDEATRANVKLLEERGIEPIGPGTGETAEGELGAGRMAEPDEIAAAIPRPPGRRPVDGGPSGARHRRRHP